MKTIQSSWWFVGVLVVFFAVSVSAEDGWLTDFEQAKAVSAKTGKPMLVDFSGSDWCGWCIRLDKEVFSQQAFKDYAKDNLILVLADFPRSKKLPENVSKQNEALAEKYNVMGFPTVLLLDAKESILGRTGYKQGGAEAYVAHLKELLASPVKP